SEGVCSYRSTGGLTSQLAFGGDFNDGYVMFDVRVSSEMGFDCLRFYIDGVAQAIGTSRPCRAEGGHGLSGEVTWRAIAIPVAAGIHHLVWSYEKDDVGDAGLDSAWIDNVSLPLKPPAAPSFTSGAMPEGIIGADYLHTFTANGSPQPSFQVTSGTF